MAGERQRLIRILTMLRNVAQSLPRRQGGMNNPARERVANVARQLEEVLHDVQLARDGWLPAVER